MHILKKELTSGQVESDMKFGPAFYGTKEETHGRVVKVWSWKSENTKGKLFYAAAFSDNGSGVRAKDFYYDKPWDLLNAINHFLLGEPVEPGMDFIEFINQGERECFVLGVNRSRFRIEFEMPNCIQEGWRSGIRVAGKLYYSPVTRSNY